MSLGVQSYPELYTLLLGWDLYDKLWYLLTETGLAYFPFIGMILKNVAHSYIGHGHHNAGHQLQSMEINLLGTLLIIFFGVAPCVPLDAHTVSYSPVCHAENSAYYPGATGTTYDKAFIIPAEEVHVPLWWYAVVSVSEGMTSAANTMLGCVPNLRKMVTEVDMTQISNSETRQEVEDFATMCYAPAKMQYMNDRQTNNTLHLEQVQKDIDKYGVEDTEWVGSHAFNDIYYKNLKATHAIPGFHYEANEDINSDVAEVNPPAYGAPSCYEWWNDKENGLKTRLFQALPKTFSDEFKEFVKSEPAQDDVIKTIISNRAHDFKGYSNANDTIGDVGYSHLVSTLGIWFHQLEEYPKLYAASQAAPIIQALLLLMVYVFLPFGLVFSGYKPAAFISGAVLIFSLIFWAFIWHLVSWTDTALMRALYSNWFARQGAGATLADMIVGSLVVAAPIFWFMFLGAMQVTISNVVGATLLGLNKISASAAQKGADRIKNSSLKINQ